ncbi:Aste57867_11968 [Aphanomyces stellatus]|uniref:Aste57867_11968 protein n=1 Tax=Aphanomyces stellatus TaxID=120398 RepID=A0A485KVJ8_9STRA|nr:hypothetical protein As57867_011923 [Aphanomyces stellatus]VFT88823.1 Aste57867_11968 [Aphanomyces stellatus]
MYTPQSTATMSPHNTTDASMLHDLPHQVQAQWELLQQIKQKNAALRDLVRGVDNAAFSYPLPAPAPSDEQATKAILSWYFADAANAASL